MCQIRAGGGCLHESGGNYLGYLKRNKIEKRGGGTKILQRGGGSLGQGVCALKLVSAIFYQIFIFHQMIALQKL